MNKAYTNSFSVCRNVAVTSVRFCGCYILAGIGGDLLVFNPSEDTEIKIKTKIFENSVIHGVSQNTEKTKVCVFGGRNIACLHADLLSSKPKLRVTHNWTVNDWVMCCQWLEGATQLAVLSAHNDLSLWDLVTGVKLAQVFCTDRSILYSGTIVGRVWREMVVIAGTVFQQIVIWTVADDSSGERLVMHKLCGHKGVIFSVAYDSRFHRICSTSDDRSIRVWSIIFPKNIKCAVEDWKGASVTLAFTIFGHTARVWQSCVLSDKKIISIGEDSLLSLWQDGGDCVYSRETHQGGGLWCLDVSEEQRMIVTGGADGGISLWPLDCPSPSSQPLPQPPDVPRRIALLPGKKVVVVTDSGTLLHYADKKMWTTVLEDSRMSSYCLLEVSPSRNLIALGSIHGNIVVLRSDTFSTEVDVQTDEGRLYSLHWLSDDTLFSCHGDGKLFVWRICNSCLEKLGSAYLPPCKERWTTSATIFDSTIIYGDRVGNIHSFPLFDRDSDYVSAVRTVRKAHSRLGVCSLNVIDSYVWSTGRDGSVKQFVVSDHSLTLVSRKQMPYNWVANVVQTKLLGPLILSFHESSVILWIMKERKTLTSMECGGGHRSWSCFLEDEQFCFSYLKNKTAHILHIPLLQISKPVVMEGFHPKEINSMSLIAEGWVVTGGEDGSVRVSRFSGGSWTTPMTEYSHVSSVRAVCTYKTLLFSGGSRAQIKVWRVDIDSESVLELCSEMLNREKKGRHWLSSSPTTDVDTRYMDLHAVPLTESTICVFAACSDSFLRTFHFDVTSNRLHLEDSVRSSQHCLLRVRSIQSLGNKTLAITTATDGAITFWLSGTSVSERLHQSGVNALSVHKLDQDLILVITGGDDNKLYVCCFRVFTSPLVVHKIAYWESSTLHSSVITGVEIVGDHIICGGGDQRVSLLSWSLVDHCCLSVQLVIQCHCFVPDIKGLSVLQHDNDKIVVCVYGVGFEVLQLEKKKR